MRAWVVQTLTTFDYRLDGLSLNLLLLDNLTGNQKDVGSNPTLIALSFISAVSDYCLCIRKLNGK